MDSGDQSRSRQRLRAVALAAVVAGVALSTVAGASPATAASAKLTPAEQLFVRQYKALVPKLDKASEALINAVNNVSKYTDAKVVTVFGLVAREWSSATAPLLTLKAPPQVASTFATIKHEVPAIEADLLAAVKAGRTHNFSGGKAAGHKLAIDFNALGAAVGKLKKALSLP